MPEKIPLGESSQINVYILISIQHHQENKLSC